MTFFINHFYIFLTIIFTVPSQLIIKWKMSEYYLSQYNSLFEKFYFAFEMLFNGPLTWKKIVGLVFIVLGIIISRDL